jgi:hypothetical protein
MTDVLYKYRSMATEDARKHTLDILDKLHLYCPPAAFLNDPFECQAVISFDAPPEVKNERAKEQLVRENHGLTETEARRRAPERWRLQEADKGAEFRHRFREDTGMICFSMCRDDILMWSHYAGSHDGICIEFRLAHKSHIDFFSNVHQVHYEDQLPTVNFYAPPSPQKVNAFIFTKAKHWSYEQEWRRVVPDAKERSRFVDLPPGIISAIYLGCQISPENKAEILGRIASRRSLRNVRVYQAKRHSHAYALTFCSVIEATTDKWFQETVARINRDVKPDTPENKLLFSILPVASNYCKAIFLLADTDHKLPAMALLRVLAELTLRVMWCLYEDNSKKEAPSTRIMRWWRTTCEEEIKHLKRMLPAADPEEAASIDHAIISLQSEIAKNPNPSAGSLYKSLDELPRQIKDDLYPLLYSPFNRAIHPNLKLFDDLVRQEGNDWRFLPDLQRPDAGVLKICAMTDAYDLLAVVHFHYGWDCEGMKAEYLKIKEDFADQVGE